MLTLSERPRATGEFAYKVVVLWRLFGKTRVWASYAILLPIQRASHRHGRGFESPGSAFRKKVGDRRLVTKMGANVSFGSGPATARRFINQKQPY
jgi:hypothetical protein